MKKIFLTLPILAAIAGCSTPSQSETGNTTAPATTTENTTENAAATDAAATDNAATETATDAPGAGATETAAASTRTYALDTEAPPGLPADIAAALKKARVPPPPASLKIAPKTRVQLLTSKGKIVVEVDGKAAPLQAKSFVYLTQRKFYDGVTFHRYEPGFVIQGGDPLTKNKALMKKYNDKAAGSGGPGYSVPRETNDLKHDAMAIAAARTGDPDSAGSQFYFTLEPSHFLDQDQAQDGYGYVVFGKVVSGQEVVKKLRAGDEIKSATVLK